MLLCPQPHSARQRQSRYRANLPSRRNPGHRLCRRRRRRSRCMTVDGARLSLGMPARSPRPIDHPGRSPCPARSRRLRQVPPTIRNHYPTIHRHQDKLDRFLPSCPTADPPSAASLARLNSALAFPLWRREGGNSHCRLHQRLRLLLQAPVGLRIGWQRSSMVRRRLFRPEARSLVRCGRVGPIRSPKAGRMLCPPESVRH